MDNGTIITLFAGAITALSGAVAYQHRHQLARERDRGDEWKALYEAERAAHDETRRLAAGEGRADAQAIREQADAVQQLAEAVRGQQRPSPPRRRSPSEAAR